MRLNDRRCQIVFILTSETKTYAHTHNLVLCFQYGYKQYRSRLTFLFFVSFSWATNMQCWISKRNKKNNGEKNQRNFWNKRHQRLILMNAERLSVCKNGIECECESEYEFKALALICQFTITGGEHQTLANKLEQQSEIKKTTQKNRERKILSTLHRIASIVK